MNDLRMEAEIQGGGMTQKKDGFLYWQSPAREFQQRGQAYYVALIILTLAITSILFVLREYTFGLAIVGLSFVLFAMNRYAPPEVTYQLRDFGFSIDNQDFSWGVFDYYFIENKEDYSVLYAKMTVMPREISVIIPEAKIAEVAKSFSRHVEYREFRPDNIMFRLSEIVEEFPFNPDAPVPLMVRRWGAKLMSRFGKITSMGTKKKSNGSNDKKEGDVDHQEFSPKDDQEEIVKADTLSVSEESGKSAQVSDEVAEEESLEEDKDKKEEKKVDPNFDQVIGF